METTKKRIKAVLCIALAAIMALGMTSCGSSDKVDNPVESTEAEVPVDSKEDVAAKGKEVAAMIDALGTVTVDSFDDANAARKAFLDLSEEDKAYVTNVDALREAIKTVGSPVCKEVVKRLNQNLASDEMYFYPQGMPYESQGNLSGSIFNDKRSFCLPFIEILLGSGTTEPLIYVMMLSVDGEEFTSVEITADGKTYTLQLNGSCGASDDSTYAYSAVNDEDVLAAMDAIANSTDAEFKFVGAEGEAIKYTDEEKAGIKDALKYYDAQLMNWQVEAGEV